MIRCHWLANWIYVAKAIQKPKKNLSTAIIGKEWKSIRLCDGSLWILVATVLFYCRSTRYWERGKWVLALSSLTFLPFFRFNFRNVYRQQWSQSYDQQQLAPTHANGNRTHSTFQSNVYRIDEKAYALLFILFFHNHYPLQMPSPWHEPFVSRLVMVVVLLLSRIFSNFWKALTQEKPSDGCTLTIEL